MHPHALLGFPPRRCFPRCCVGNCLHELKDMVINGFNQRGGSSDNCSIISRGLLRSALSWAWTATLAGGCFRLSLLLGFLLLFGSSRRSRLLLLVSRPASSLINYLVSHLFYALEQGFGQLSVTSAHIRHLFLGNPKEDVKLLISNMQKHMRCLDACALVFGSPEEALHEVSILLHNGIHLDGRRKELKQLWVFKHAVVRSVGQLLETVSATELGIDRIYLIV
mmetsp:Transcript_64087/g.152842  ORF Transcript_64087/g.152842 Transcript_64087/m.152842 type:complete len:223 (+) Transcript_64087:145-813(+)